MAMAHLECVVNEKNKGAGRILATRHNKPMSELADELPSVADWSPCSLSADINGYRHANGQLEIIAQ